MGLPSGLIASILRLKIYKKRPRIKNKNPSKIQQHGVNCRIIHQIRTYNQDASEHIKNIRLGTLNARSIKSKEEFIMENFIEYKLDALLITETCLQKRDEDDIWLQTSEFCKDDHEIFNINRQDKMGRGIALLYTTKYKIKTVRHTKYNSFESGIWNINYGSMCCTLLDTYHPPVGTQQGITNIFMNNLT